MSIFRKRFPFGKFKLSLRNLITSQYEILYSGEYNSEDVGRFAGMNMVWNLIEENPIFFSTFPDKSIGFAVKQLSEGKRIRRSCWTPYTYIQIEDQKGLKDKVINRRLVRSTIGSQISVYYNLSVEDLQATDWELACNLPC